MPQISVIWHLDGPSPKNKFDVILSPNKLKTSIIDFFFSLQKI